MGLVSNKVHPSFKLNGISYTEPELKEVAYRLIKKGVPYEEHIGDFLLSWLNDKTTVEVQTSGSTGNPKTIRLQKQHMVNSAMATGYFFKLKASNTALLCLPASYIAGKMMLVRAMVLGLELDYVAPSSNPLIHINKSYDFAAMIPLQVENSINSIEQIKTLIVGGASFSGALKEKVQDSATAVYETYGMTETITHIALKKITTSSGTAEAMFETLPNVTVSIDERECLVIDAPEVADKPVITNDIVKLISDSEFEWLGRYDTIVNSGGIKLIPEQIELKLKHHIKNPFFLLGLPDTRLGQKLVLLVEGRIDSLELFKEIKSLMELSKYEIPKEIHRLDTFCYTETGKINRIATLELLKK